MPSRINGAHAMRSDPSRAVEPPVRIPTSRATRTGYRMNTPASCRARRAAGRTHRSQCAQYDSARGAPAARRYNGAQEPHDSRRDTLIRGESHDQPATDVIGGGTTDL